MSDMEMSLVAGFSCCIVALWLRIRALENQLDNDYRHLEWWLKSQENRKADKEEKEVE